jgi:hypothetical protein
LHPIFAHYYNSVFTFIIISALITSKPGHGAHGAVSKRVNFAATFYEQIFAQVDLQHWVEIHKTSKANLQDFL